MIHDHHDHHRSPQITIISSQLVTSLLLASKSCHGRCKPASMLLFLNSNHQLQSRLSVGQPLPYHRPRCDTSLESLHRLPPTSPIPWIRHVTDHMTRFVTRPACHGHSTSPVPRRPERTDEAVLLGQWKDAGPAFSHERYSQLGYIPCDRRHAPWSCALGEWKEQSLRSH